MIGFSDARHELMQPPNQGQTPHRVCKDFYCLLVDAFFPKPFIKSLQINCEAKDSGL